MVYTGLFISKCMYVLPTTEKKKVAATNKVVVVCVMGLKTRVLRGVSASAVRGGGGGCALYGVCV